MFLGRVKGHVVATAKDPSVKGRKLLVIEPLRVHYDHPVEAARPDANGAAKGSRFEVTGRAIITMDMTPEGTQSLTRCWLPPASCCSS